MAHKWVFQAMEAAQKQGGGQMAVWKCENCFHVMKLPETVSNFPPRDDLLIRVEDEGRVLRLTCEERVLSKVQLS
jgi:hypothetical protein